MFRWAHPQLSQQVLSPLRHWYFRLHSAPRCSALPRLTRRMGSARYFPIHLRTDGEVRRQSQPNQRNQPQGFISSV
eukprot:189374-Prorocentrum_minimum.AAC.2